MSRTVVHDTFVIDRTYAAAPERVYTAFADSAAKLQWWGDPSIEGGSTHEIDFRIGGRESMRGSIPDGPSFSYDALYQDIVDGSRIVYSYEMTMNGKRISVSVATLEFYPVDGGTRLILTEQGAYLDGLDTNAAREHGTNELFNALGSYLEGSTGS